MKPHSIKFVVVSIFILATLITSAIAISLQYHFSKTIATEASRQLFSLSVKNTQNHLEDADRQAKNISQIFAQFEDLMINGEFNEKSFQVLTKALDTGPGFYSAYLGYENGDFSQIINLEANATLRSKLKAKLSDRWVYVNINGADSTNKSTITFLDTDLKIRAKEIRDSNFDPTTRPWYKSAIKNGVYKTKPYLFQHLKIAGQSYSTRTPDGKGVFAVDYTLTSMNDYIVKQGQNEQGVTDKEVYLFQQSGEIIASNQKAAVMTEIGHINQLDLTPEQQRLVKNTPLLNVSNETDWAPIDFATAGRPMGYSIDLLNIISQMTGLQFSFQNGYTWTEFLQGFKTQNIDILQPIFNYKANRDLGLVSDPFLDLPFVLVTLNGIDNISSLHSLFGKRLALLENSTISQNIKAQYPQIEVVEYPSSREVIQAVNRKEVYAALETGAIINYTEKHYFVSGLKKHHDIDLSSLDIASSLHFLLQKPQKDLLDIINLAIANVSDAQTAQLEQKWLSAKMAKPIANLNTVVPYKALIDLSKDKKQFNKLVPIVTNGQDKFAFISPLNHANTEFFAVVVDKNVVLGTAINKVKVSLLITMGCLLFILPISWFLSRPIVNPIKQLSIENDKIRKRQYSEVKLVKSSIQEINALASSLNKMSVEIEQHELQQQALMDSFIQMIAQTIDDKSAYTGGHCNRVPELGLMLVDKVAKDDGTFKDFSFKNADEYREFKIAAWLHDCGKIITPEHIVDKGSKLETIYNRIHEIRMRFEVLWRDAEIRYYQDIITSPNDEEPLRQLLNQTHQKLTEDFTLVANMNVGGEFMSETRINELNVIAQQTWQRHFDDRLGLSPKEQQHLAKHNKNHTTEQTLPVTEALLADKPEHIYNRSKKVEFDEKLGIKVTVPENYANLGELYNLSISRGTLTNEDRYIINEHIIGTIKMLDQLPFPPELANVPKFASTHHETLIGTGYPRQLTADDLSVPERVLVLADIFEALTAADRPYKTGKPLSVAIKIMHQFVLDQHIDVDLFELFLTSGTYLDYAHKYMKKSQIDTVDIDAYLR